MASEQEFQQHMTERVTRRVTGIVTKAVMFVIFAALAILLFGVAVYLLWNWLMPTIFHLPAIQYWQAVGLLFLSWILFGGRRGFGGRPWGHPGRWRHRMRERWERMTPEEREKFRQGMHGCWARVAPPETKPGA
jgi:Ca2+/H+ antiporter, TMEM165/GDT1 family